MTLGELAKALETSYRIEVMDADNKLIADFYSTTADSITDSVLQAEISLLKIKPNTSMGATLEVVLKGTGESEESI